MSFTEQAPHLCRRLGIKDNEKRWAAALADNVDAKRDRAVVYVLLLVFFCSAMTFVGSFLRTRWKTRKALAMEQRKALGIENPVIILETDAAEAMSQQESPRSPIVEMEEASHALDASVEDASPTSPDETESNIEYEFETC